MAVGSGDVRENAGGRTGVAKGGTVADVNRLGDTETEGAGAGDAGVTEDEDAGVDHRVPRVGIGAGKRGDAGTRGN